MKTLVKIRQADGEVLEVQSHPTHILSAGAGELLVEHEGDAPLLAGMKKDGEVIRQKIAEEVIAPEETNQEKRAKVLKKKEVLSNEEITEVLKMRGML